MSSAQSQHAAHRVLVLSSSAADAAMIQGLLGQAGIPHNLCSDLTDLCQQLHVGTGAVLLMEQSLSHPKAMCLAEHLRQQPEWSEVPVLVLTERLSPWEFPTWANDILASATLLAHPVHPATLLSAVRTALASRRRQYELRDYLAQREHDARVLQRERAFLRSVIDADPSLIFVKNRQGCFVLGNEAVARCYGTTPQAIQGKTDADFNSNLQEVAHFRHDDLEVMDTQQPKVIAQEQVTFANSQTHWFSTVKVPLINDDGTCDQVLGVATDITERKEAEEQLRTLNATLEERVAERTAEAEERAAQLGVLALELTRTEQRERERIAQVLHDHLQQLLVGAQFNVSTLRNRVSDPQLRRSIERIGESLDESVQASRCLTAELSPPVLRQGTFPDVIRWLLEWMHDKHNLQVDAHIDDRVHPQCPQVRQLLFEASRELLFNVVKHSGVRQAQLELTQDDADQLRLVIADSGRGFDPASARPIGDVSAACGLFTIRERLNLVGGSVQIDSAPGRGTRATLLAPIRAADIAPRQIEQPLPAQAAAPPRPAAATKGKIRVLLADDHAMVRRGLAQLLEDNGQIEVVGQASDGQEALELARRLQPDVVTMDVSMPRLSGMEATRLLHAEMPEVQVIGLSMYAESSVAEAMKAAGAVNYLAKSAPPESLVDAILACRPR